MQDADWLQTPFHLSKNRTTRRFSVLPGHSERQKNITCVFCSARRCCQILIKRHCAESSSHLIVPTLCLALGSFPDFFCEPQLGTSVTTYSTRLSDLQKVCHRSKCAFVSRTNRPNPLSGSQCGQRAPWRSLKLSLWTEISAQRRTVCLLNYIYESSLFSFPILSLGIRCLPRSACRNSSSLETEPRPFEKRPISITKGPIAGDGLLSAVKYRRLAARTRQPFSALTGCCSAELEWKSTLNGPLTTATSRIGSLF